MANGLLTKQQVNKAILMMKDSVFWTWDDNEHAWQSSQFKCRHVKKEEAKEKVRAKVGSKELVKHTLVKKQTQDTKWWSEEDSVWWSKGKKRRERFFER